MSYLLDIHVWRWWVTDRPRLSAAARTAIADETDDFLAGAAFSIAPLC